ncbi:MAG: tetratricopeptide repeat protein [Spirochaetaceae bacterium]|jgi:tetratricopeptide (TPR) repeat protein|nr:tetratricopeptide repeat protein [Spirochaetaceae bacterium]
MFAKRGVCFFWLFLFFVHSGIFSQPYDKEFYHLRAQQYLMQGNLSGALEIYNLIIGTDPKDVRAFNGRGMVYERRADLNAAMADYEHALELNPVYAEAQHNRWALMQKYKNEKAPTVTFAKQGGGRNRTVFPNSNPQEVAPPAAETASEPLAGVAAAEDDSPAPAASAETNSKTKRAVKPAVFPKLKTASEIVNSEDWRPSEDEAPLFYDDYYYVDDEEATPNKYSEDTGYGEDSGYLSPSLYQQPATLARVDGTVVRITPSSNDSKSAPVKAQSGPPREPDGSLSPVVGTRAPASGVTGPFNPSYSGYSSTGDYQNAARLAPVPQTAPAAVSTQQSEPLGAPPSGVTYSSAPPSGAMSSGAPLSIPMSSSAPSSGVMYSSAPLSGTPPLGAAPVQAAPVAAPDRPPSVAPSAGSLGRGGEVAQGVYGGVPAYQAPPAIKTPSVRLPAQNFPGGVAVVNEAGSYNSASARLPPLALSSSASSYSSASGYNVNALSAENRNNSGLTFYNAGNYTQAISEFTEAIKLFPEFTIAYNNRGVAYVKTGEYAKAMDDFNQALRLNPYYFDAQQNREITRPFVTR